MELDIRSIIQTLQQLDSDGIGSISRDELRRVIQALSAPPGALDNAAIDRLFASFGAATDSQINYEDFITWLSQGALLKVPVLDETRRLCGLDVIEVREIEQITVQELEEMRALRCPPQAVQSALAVTCLILGSAHSKLPPSRPMAWSRVQRIMADTSFIQNVHGFDVATLVAAPALVTYLASTYFHSQPAHASILGNVSESQRPSVKNAPARLPSVSSSSKTLQAMACREALTEDRVKRASKAAAALFRWCSSMLVSAAASVQSPAVGTEIGAVLEVPSVGILQEESTEITVTRSSSIDVSLLPWLILWTWQRLVLHSWRDNCALRRVKLAKLEAQHGPHLPCYVMDLYFGQGFRTVQQQSHYNTALQKENLGGPGYPVYEPYDGRLLKIERAMRQQGSDLLEKLRTVVEVLHLCPDLQLQVLTCEGASEITCTRLLSVRDWFEERPRFISCDAVLSNLVSSEDIVCRLRIAARDTPMRRFFLTRASAVATVDAMARSSTNPFTLWTLVLLEAHLLSGGSSIELRGLAVLSRGHLCAFLVNLQLLGALGETVQTILNLASYASRLESQFQVTHT